ncbi:glycoside hydrolase family 7 protein [Didymella exigua CBS 183.55]|uniref:Glucanase n=1 Tax=Didymella exigua CBS 183.55 TaxID=1150837 RepID=A0A6A5RN98_9PLEO|nr:glycoside hydrolase family 7 protein [Didymella exigua CBS 183.55]KAF1926997.1 glycoside hydrolase family 7 protein [Didymella exigua CBS 183.55]
MVHYSIIASALLAVASAQSLGNGQETHPKLTTYECTKKGGCKAQDSYVVLDAASHSIHQKNDTTKGCGNSGSAPDPAVCPDEETCAKNCVLDQISNYTDYGIFTTGASLRMDFYGKDKKVQSPRAYLLSKGKKNYEMLKLTGKEFTFDVDVSKLPCGMNGALYLSEMRADGGRSKLNPGGASVGTGYCDAQCFVTPWVNGVGNIDGSGVCCNEMDIWEANSRSAQIAPHTCSKPSLFKCQGAECGATGLCDKNGCSKNSYRNGAKDFYGLGLKIDTKKPFTVVTQFPAKNGVLQSIERKYVQNGIVFEDQPKNITLNDETCTASGADMFMKLGAMKGMGDALSRGMVLAMSVWWDESGFMHWLDNGDAGPCDATEGDPKNIVKVQPAPSATFSSIKWGEIGSTFTGKNIWTA